MIIKDKWLALHRFLHSEQQTTIIDGQQYRKSTSNNACAFTRFSDLDLGACMLMEQNKNKTTEYGARARAGATLSWVIPEDTRKAWILIDAPVLKDSLLNQEHGTKIQDQS